MTRPTLKRGGTWTCEQGGVERVWTHARPLTPAILDFEHATIGVKLTNQKLGKIQILQQGAALKISTVTAELNRMLLALKKSVGKKKPAVSDADLLAKKAELESAQIEMVELNEEFIALSAFTSAELEPYYNFALEHTLMLDDTEWHTLELGEQMEELYSLSADAIMHYVGSIMAQASLGHAKKKRTSATSASSTSNRATATSAPKRRTRKTRKKKGRNTTAKSHKSTRKSK